MKEDFVDQVQEIRDKAHKDSRRKPALGAFIEELLWPVIEGDEIMKQYGPYLEEMAIDPERILIKDNRLNQIAELTFRDHVLYCNLDGSANCVHIGYAWSIPAVNKVMHSRGEKKPHISRKDL